MTLLGSSISRRAGRFAAGAFVLFAAASFLVGHASATVKPSSNGSEPSASVEQSAAAIPVGGTIGFTAVIRLPAPASYVLTRVQIKQPSGRLVYQRTKTLSNADAGTHSFAFTRQLEGLGLTPGTYPLTLQVQATVDGSDVTTEVTSPLRVFDPDKPHVPVVLIARVDARPMADTSGRFAVDPATATKPRNDVDRIIATVMSDPAARVTLALSPLTIEEWRRISRGYTLASGVSVPAGTPVPLAYAATLQQLKAALDTGRLELTALGYADPSLADLAANKLPQDVAPQYETGISACFASLEATPSTGTVPAGGAVPWQLAKPLEAHGIHYLAIDSASVRLAKKAPASGAYPIGGVKLTALVVDGTASRRLDAGETSVAVAGSFARSQSSTPRQPYILRVGLGDGFASATETVVPALSALESLPWVRMQLGRESVPPKGAKAVALTGTPSASSQKQFWAAVRAGRANAEAMLAALGAGSAGARAAQSQSLIAESHSWTGPAGTYALAPAGISFANAAYHAGQAIFDKIHVTAQSVTLAGATGQVPVNIQNGTQETLTVYVVAKSTGGLKVVGSDRIATRLPPRETFVQIPVAMNASLGDRLTVEVVAGSLVISRQTVAVRRSYLDRVALILGIVVVLGGLLAFIVRRVATSPGLEDDDTERSDDDARYTEDERVQDEGPHEE